MARRCTTVPGFGFCCSVAQQGMLNRPVRMQTARGERCVECSTRQSQSRDPRKAGRTVFQFRFHRSADCGMGPGGCPALAPGGGGGATLMLPPPAGFQGGIVR